MRAEIRGAEGLEELKQESQREQEATREHAQLRRELAAISGTSTAGLEPPRPKLPRNAYAVSSNGTWALIVARHPGQCRQCGKNTHRNQRIARNGRTREVRCTGCVQHISFMLTDYGRRRKRGHVSRRHRP
jgi:hypothetical protein